MRWRRGKRRLPEDLRVRVDAFAVVRGSVEEAKATLLLGVPSGRAARLPLAEALAGFELLLDRARRAMEPWRGPEVAGEWARCREALLEAGLRAERLRLADPAPQGYEALAPALDRLMEPLAAFDHASARMRELQA